MTSVVELFASFAVTITAAPAARSWMLRQGCVDVPNHRSSHVVPTARGGGVACLLGLFGAVVVAVIGVPREVPWALVAGSTALSLVGYADDRADLPPGVRLSAQVIVGVAMGAALGGGWLIAVGGFVAAVVVNMVNFMDGINGITSLSLTVWGAAAWVVGTVHDSHGLQLIGAAVIGCSLGFLPWNAPSARLFLGDVGSYLFGGLVTAGLVLGLSSGVPMMPLLAPLMIYAADTTATLVRRAARRESLVQAHREHVYQRLVSTPRITHLAASTGVAVLGAVLTATWLWSDVWISVPVTALVTVLYLASPRLISASPLFSIDVPTRSPR